MTTVMATERAIPAQRDNESLRAYYGRLLGIYQAIRSYLPHLRADAADAGKARDIPVVEAARQMGVSAQWVYDQAPRLKKYDASRLPRQRTSEDDLQYYLRLRDLRDDIEHKLPELLAPAVREAELEENPPTRTQIAAEMGMSVAYLQRLLKRFDRNEG